VDVEAAVPHFCGAAKSSLRQPHALILEAGLPEMPSWGSSSEGLPEPPVSTPGRSSPGIVRLPASPPLRVLHISGSSRVHGRRGDTYVVYHIRIACAGAFPSAWTCYRRYAEFDRAYAELRALKIACAPPPPKRLFGNLSASFLAERSRLLEAWLRDLSPAAVASAPGRRFLSTRR